MLVIIGIEYGLNRVQAREGVGRGLSINIVFGAAMSSEAGLFVDNGAGLEISSGAEESA